ncbi:Dyp-type peroxidase [Kitasatospora sp. NBC_00070]|uniref:Dyp-type peroxidase n=1 Tax=Kitasatospora sp. NBC_00070 TaxID=2975962 RepID=UPI00325644E2
MAATAAAWGAERVLPRSPQVPAPPPRAVPALRQPGLDTPQLPHALLLAYDLPDASGSRAASALSALLGGWTGTTRTAAVTAVLGVGPGLPRRVPLRVPEAFGELPALPGDRLDPARSGADVLLQLCGDDPEVLGATADLLDRQAGGLLAPRWRQAGHLPPTPPGETPRNLFAFKDGTANPGASGERWVWLPDGPYAGGTFLVYRRIAMRTAAFAGLSGEEQEAVIGRRRDDGRPLGGAHEHDEPDFGAKTPNGRYVIPATAHIRAANPRLDGGARMLRRGYTYSDGPDDEGLLFCAYMTDPALFVRVQRRMAESDALTPFVEHRASAVLFVPPGAPAGASLGESLFARG